MERESVDALSAGFARAARARWDFFFGLFIPEACYACATSGTPSDGVLLLRHDAIQNLMLVLLVSYSPLAQKRTTGPIGLWAPELFFLAPPEPELLPRPRPAARAGAF